jgi:transcriptional regulator with GAF, ATPase, and Fis domain
MSTISAALLPTSEHERLASLYHYERLSFQQESIFDELVALSAYLFGVPISYITLVDAEHLRYQASHNAALPPPVPRQQLLCAHVIEQNQVIWYHDIVATTPTALDTTAIQHALAQRVRFYAGAPVRMPNQKAIGTLCLAGHQPRSFSPQEQRVLEHLACVASQTVLHHHCHSHTPVLSETSWQELRGQVRDEIRSLVTLVRYLLRRHGPAVPVPQDTLHLVMRRLQDIHDLLTRGVVVVPCACTD